MSADPPRHARHIHPVLTFPVSTALLVVAVAAGTEQGQGVNGLQHVAERQADACGSKPTKVCSIVPSDFTYKTQNQDKIIKNFKRMTTEH